MRVVLMLVRYSELVTLPRHKSSLSRELLRDRVVHLRHPYVGLCCEATTHIIGTQVNTCAIVLEDVRRLHPCQLADQGI